MSNSFDGFLFSILRNQNIVIFDVNNVIYDCNIA